MRLRFDTRLLGIAVFACAGAWCLSLARTPRSRSDRCGPRHIAANLWVSACDTTIAEWSSYATQAHVITTAEQARGALVFSLERGAMEWRQGVSVAHPVHPAARADAREPATQITASEAEGYCASLGGRLPYFSELQRLRTSELIAINVWQGSFPVLNELSDGYLFASPVATFPASSRGIYDLLGNVWQWTASEPEPGHRRIFGGSFLCDERVCRGWQSRTQTARANEPAMHIGFRCVWDHPPPPQKS